MSKEKNSRRASLASVLMGVPFMALMACDPPYSPKPRAYPRIDFPEHRYQLYDPDTCPFQFEMPSYAEIQPYEFGKAEPCWQTVHFRPFDAQLHLSYKPVAGDKERLYKMAEDARSFVYRHTVKAQTVDEAMIRSEEQSVYGIFYTLGGETASAVQFFVTDSSRHYLRGALYFKARTNRDSLAPVIDFLEKDIRKIVRSLRWQRPTEGPLARPIASEP